MSRKPRRQYGAPFLKGTDPRRHKLTKAERQRGFEATFQRVVAGELSQRWLAGVVKATCGRHARY